MPELPEVEIACRNLARWALEKTIVRAAAPKSPVLGKASARGFAASLKGARLSSLERRGKNVVATLAGGGGKHELGLRIHLGMTGKIVRRTAMDSAPRFSRAVFELDDGHSIHFCDMRMFGRLELGPLGKIRARAFDSLGPDPLGDRFGAAVLRQRLARRRVALKIALMDQTVLAGLGNIHVAEALWRARLSPFRRSNSLDAPETARLARAILASIRHALDAQDGPEIVYVEEPGSDNPFTVYDRLGERCPRCKKPIRRTVQGGRSTFYCGGCQR